MGEDEYRAMGFHHREEVQQLEVFSYRTPFVWVYLILVGNSKYHVYWEIFLCCNLFKVGFGFLHFFIP